MVAMWHRMGAFFGAAWESQYGGVEDQTISAWAGALGAFTVGELAGAIKAMEGWEEKFPPTFPEFRAVLMAQRGQSRPNWTDERIEAEQTRGRGVAGVLEDLAKGPLTETAKAELAKMAQIAADEIDVPKAESWRHLSLDRIRGPLPELT
jgi:hypothetical protein